MPFYRAVARATLFYPIQAATEKEAKEKAAERLVGATEGTQPFLFAGGSPGAILPDHPKDSPPEIFEIPPEVA